MSAIHQAEYQAKGASSSAVKARSQSLAYAIKEVGAEPFVFSTDYPHEVTVEMCRHEIQELMENETTSRKDKTSSQCRCAFVL